MTFPTPDEAYLAVAVLAPGFIILFIRSRFVTGDLPSVKEGALYYVLLSVVYYSVALPVFPGLDFRDGPKNIMFFGSSRNSGEGGADLEKEVGVIAEAVGHPLDDL
ncbi:hypothetical protein GGD88_003672, partial [Roseospira goensis]|nr:hypothetical protein [Roseospira goensis]